MYLRELVTKLGFEVDEAKIKNYEGSLERLISLGKKAAIAYFSKEAIMGFLNISDSAEKSFLAIEGMAGSTEKAKKLLTEVKGITGVFGAPELTKAAKQMLGYNMEAEKVPDSLRQIGNVAAIAGEGSAEMLERVADMYGRVQARGASGRQLVGFMEAGIPILDTLSRQLGVQKTDLMDIHISTKQFNAAFKELANTNFTDGMIRASHTWGGMLQVASNIWHEIAHEIGDSIMPYAKNLLWAFNQWKLEGKEGAIKTLTGLFRILAAVASFLGKVIADIFFSIGGGGKEGISVFEGLADAVEGLLEFLYDWRAIIYVIIGVMAIHKIAIIAHAAYIGAAAIATNLWTIAQAALNVVMLAFPVFLIIAAIAALIYGAYQLIQNWDLVKKKFMEWTAIFDNPIFAAIATILMPFITIPILIARNWDKLKQTVGEVIDWVSNKASGIASFFGFGGETESPKVEGSRASGGRIHRTGLYQMHAGEDVIPAGGRGGGGSSVVNNITVPVTLSVPAGTPQSQAQYLKKICGEVMDEAWQGILRQAKFSNPVVNSEGA